MNSACGFPDFYNDLALSFERAWALIEAGAEKRSSPAHTPSVATVDATCQVSQRIMVLRGVDRTTRMLRFHTDARSAKAAQGGAASVLLYDPALKIQLRLNGQAKIEERGETVEAAWSASTEFARRCYMAMAAPGCVSSEPTSGLPSWIEGKQPKEEQLADYRPNFALFLVAIDRIEWLHLANAGHRRAVWHWSGNGWSGNWLVP